MSNEVKNIPASIHGRLINIARKNNESMETLLYRYTVERFLYRLSISKYRTKLLLKGAFLFTIWSDTPHRTTRDIDFLGMIPEEIDSVTRIIKEICSIECHSDGLVFKPNSIVCEEIRKDKIYGGMRLTQTVYLGKTRILLQIDIGTGDIVTPKADEMEVPTLLEMPKPNLLTYPIYTVIAEKFEALVSLGLENSRMKDFYDLLVLTNDFDFNIDELKLAIYRTFERRKTSIPSHPPTALSKEFSENDVKNIQWNAFLRKNGFSSKEYSLPTVIEALHTFFSPILKDLASSSN